MSGDLHRQADNVCAKTTALPKEFEAAPTLDEWAFVRAFGNGSLILTGCCSGDAGLARVLEDRTEMAMPPAYLVPSPRQPRAWEIV